MNDNIKQWLAALRSGDYQQTTGYLHDAVGWCCLGVGCDVFDKANPGILCRGASSVGETFDNHRIGLPAVVRDWLGVTEPFGLYGKGWSSSLAFDNDNGKTFVEIADIIESEPEGLFTDGR